MNLTEAKYLLMAPWMSNWEQKKSALHIKTKESESLVVKLCSMLQLKTFIE